jgi:peptidoglycan/LPS O-acetylase OafA/YrhL
MSPKRIPALDGLRGVLACVVVLCHTHVAFGGTSLNGIAASAVFIFFIMSSYVLARAHDGSHSAEIEAVWRRLNTAHRI